MVENKLQSSKMELDPDKIFESKNIDELVSYSRTLSRNIDQKQEELRTMVGERYRDLMEAAETITHMKDRSEDIIRGVDKVISLGGEINAKSLLGFSSYQDRNARVIEDVNEPYLATAAEIKLLTMAPEKIWSSVERKDFPTAAQIYLFARHIHTDLTLSEDRGPVENDAKWSVSRITSAYFPVVSRQWASISHFYDVILNACKSTIKTIENSSEDECEKVIGALTAWIMLQNLSVQDLCSEFFKLRMQSLEDNLERDTKHEPAKALIEKTLNFISTTLIVLHQAFLIENGRGLQQSYNKSCQPTIALFETRLSPVFKYLPEIISQFTPGEANELLNVKRDFLSKATLSWLDSIYDKIVSATQNVLTHVKSISALSSIRKHSYQLLSNEKVDQTVSWNRICNSLTGKTISLWDEFYRGVFRERIKDIVSSQISGAVFFVQSTIAEDKNFDSEMDLSLSLWSEGNLHETVILKHLGNVDKSRQSRQSSNELRAKGYSKRVQNLCSQFDKMLTSCWNDLKMIHEEKASLKKGLESKASFSFFAESSNEDIAPFDPSVDNEEILQYCQERTVFYVNSLLNHISSTFLENSDTANAEGLLLFLGRLLQGIPELCPSLEVCANAPCQFDHNEYSSFHQRTTKDGKKDHQWQILKQKLEKECEKILGLWINKLSEKLSKSFESALLDDDDLQKKTKDIRIFPAWDKVEISEETDEGRIVKSIIRVPQHPSIPLVCGLTNYCESVYKVAPFSMPQVVQGKISQIPITDLSKVYQKACSRANIDQQVALQLFFDIHFIMHSMITRDNKEASKVFEDSLSLLENVIDPFDMSVFQPHLMSNIKRSVLRHHGFFSILIPNDRHAMLASVKSSLVSSSTSSSQQEQQHNVMWSFGKRPEKIPLLPVPKKKKENRLLTVSASASALAKSPSGSLVSPMSGRRKRDKSPIARTAGSFFEGLSSSWFGGK